MSLRPTWPGFGFTTAPERKRFNYSFDNLAKVVQAFTDAIGLDRYAIYVFDYGAPIGFRLALACPERVTAIISQNGNAYSSPAAQNDMRVIFALRHSLSRGGEERGSRNYVRDARNSSMAWLNSSGFSAIGKWPA
jgi:pimeloyl-ACP methyl ester carboxylesterase